MYYKQPRYFGEFQCIGSDCPDNCCYGWRIDWDKTEVDKVLNASNISHELKDLVEKSFVPNRKYNGRFQIEFNEYGKCPFQTAEGLCKIQKELGAEYLSNTCTFYPRCTIGTADIFYRYCNTSCPVIIQYLLNNENSMELISKPFEENSRKKEPVTNSMNELKENTEIKYRSELLEFYYDLLSDKKIPVETALTLGALAAQSLTKLVDERQCDRIPEALKAFRKQFHNATQLKKIENIPPKYHLKFGFLSELIEKLIKDGATALLHDETGMLNIDLYNEGEWRLNETLKGREFFLRNLALNLLFEFSVPLHFKDKTIFENYSLFVAAYGLLKLNLIAVCSTEKGITMRTCGQEFVYHNDDKLIGMTAIISRGICQSKNKAHAIIKLLNDNNFTTPAYLALLIK